ncbi:hypothetical protein JN01_0702 [Entomoplasma freundtii]|uniref:Uncharacterized protein n=1 Tax=Entomoplasma freundtii TaxID=74700 RepID=A0A2K8NSF2_9MOLU|nr:hypothetical protein [Entomoplasma freundtii]ATZ16486.1 hypothetical protein EFREU_v1c04600 [Entomoplasma freundtii]TDY56015.1 hypothetical protein JN01_0702 [Entomoplasma freundtii]
MHKFVLSSLASLAIAPISTSFSMVSSQLNQESSTLNYQMYQEDNKTSPSLLSEPSNLANNTEYRLYLDSSGDKLTYKENAIDQNLGYQSKDIWYDLEILIAIYNFDDFSVTTKSELITKIGSKFSLDYYYAFNMWDSWKGWRYNGGKNVDLKKDSSTITLATEAHTDEIHFEKASSGTEASRIQIRQQWSNKELKIFLRLSV